MSYTSDLAEILTGVTSSFQLQVDTMHDGVRAYMVDYVRRGCSMKTVFNAYVYLSRVAADVAKCDNGGSPLPLERLTRHHGGTYDAVCSTDS